MSDAASQLRQFVSAVYGGCAGFVEVTHATGGKLALLEAVPVDQFLLDPTEILDRAAEGRNIYLGCVTLSRVPPKRSRGKSELRLDVPGVWLDLDIETAGHHKRVESGLRRLRNADEASDVITAAGLPDPTALVHSGGGLYAWWLYPEPLCLQSDEGDRAQAVALSDAVNTRVADVAKEMGIAVDRTSDMVRVLRPPGAVNWKGGLSDAKPVRLLYLDEELRIFPEELAALLEDVSPARSVVRKSASERSTGASGASEEGDSLPDAAKAASWEEILFPLGWTYGAPVSGATSFLRPGYSVDAGGKPGDGYGSSSGNDDGAKSAGVYDDGPEVLVVWSDACGLPSGSGQKLTKFRVMSHIWFNGSMAATAGDLGAAALARAAGACSGADEDIAGVVRSVWPGSVLDKALELLGGGWKSTSQRLVWTVKSFDGLRRVSRS